MSVPTGDGLSSALVTVRFLLPADPWWSQTLLGSVDYLTYVKNFDAVGSVTPSIAALEFLLAVTEARVEALSTGQIVCFPADNMQYINQDPLQGASQWQKCEGQSLTTAAFPDLFNVIGYTFGGAGANFNVPDMRGRTVVDVGHGSGLSPYALGDTFGEETHTLSSGEMPVHSHTTGNSLLLGTSVPPPLDALGPNPLPAFTGNAGGGGSHENRQPSIALFYYIQVVP